MRTPAGIMPTRYSLVLISVGTPMIMYDHSPRRSRVSMNRPRWAAPPGRARLWRARMLRALEHRQALQNFSLAAQDRLDAELVLQVHLEVVLGEELVFGRLAVLAHHDDRRLQRRHRRQAQVEEDVRID